MRRIALPSILAFVLPAFAALAQTAPADEKQAPTPAPAAPALFGERFPGGTFENLNDAGGVRKINLEDILGRRPVVLYYWIAGNTRSEKIFQELQALAGEFGPGKIVLYGVATPPLGSTDTLPIRGKVQELKIHVPVLYDDGFRIGRALGVRAVPSINVIDSQGKLRLANAGGLRQTLEYKMSVEDAIRRVAETGDLGTYGSLPKYYPASELVGERCPDFEAPTLEGATRRWSEMLDPERVNVLIFWSVDCPHCRKSLPEINEWLKTKGEGINLVTAAKVSSEATKVKTAEFCAANDFAFPTLVDWDLEIGRLYQVTSTPTVLVIRPDGVVDSVLLSGETDYGRALEAKRKQLLDRS